MLVVTFDEWGGFFDHVPPPRVIDDTNPADVDHTGDSTTPTDGRLVPDYRQLGFRVPAIVVSNLADDRVVHHGPFEHTSTLKLIESTFGLQPLTARDANAENLGQVLRPRPAAPGPGRRHPDQQPGAGAGQRRRRDLQRGQRPVGLATSGAPGQAPGAGSAALPLRGPIGRRDGGIRPPVPPAKERVDAARSPREPHLIPSLTRSR